MPLIARAPKRSPLESRCPRLHVHCARVTLTIMHEI